MSTLNENANKRHVSHSEMACSFSWKPRHPGVEHTLRGLQGLEMVLKQVSARP